MNSSGVRARKSSVGVPALSHAQYRPTKLQTCALRLQMSLVHQKSTQFEMSHIQTT